MRGFSLPNERSVSKTIAERASQKFQPVEIEKRQSSMPTNKEQQEKSANSLKKLAERDEITPRAYTLNAPGNVSFVPSRQRDNRDYVITNSSRALREALTDKVGNGGIEIELSPNGFKALASERSKLSDDEYNVIRARSIFSVKIATHMPNVSRHIVAAIEYDSNAEKTAQYKLSEYFVDINTQKKIAFNSSALKDFINTGKTSASDRTRTASRQGNDGDNPYGFKRKLVVCRFDGPVTRYMEIKVNDVEKSASLLRQAGFTIEKRVFDKTYGDVQGPVLEVIATTAQLKKIDAMLRSAGEFTEFDRKPHNDEAPNTKSGEPFKNEEQIDDPKKWPGRSEEKNKPSYMKSTPHDMSKDSEDKAFDEKLYDQATSFPGRSEEKNHEGLPKKPEHKPHSDEQPNKEGQNPNMPGPGKEENPQDWPYRSLETGTTLGVGEMLRYERYKQIREAKLTFGGMPMPVPTGAVAAGASSAPVGGSTNSPMAMPLGGNAQTPPAAPAPMPTPASDLSSDQIGNITDDGDIDVMQDDEGKVVLVVPKDKLIDLAGGIGKKEIEKPIANPAANMPSPATTPDNQGLPGSVQANKKKAESVPLPNGGSSKFQEAPNVGKSTSPMDGMSHGKKSGGEPSIVPTEEFKKYKAVAFVLAFPEANAAFAAAQRLAIKANEFRLCTKASDNGPILIRPLTKDEFAQSTRTAAKMVGKRANKTNPYVVTVEHLRSDANNPFSKIILDSLKKEKAQADGTAAPNSAAPKNPNGSPTSMDGLNHGKSDMKDKTGFKSSDEQQAKEDVIGGINKNPEKPNISGNHGAVDGMNHGKSSGEGEKVKPSSEFNKENPVKHMAKYEGTNRVLPIGKVEHHDFREQLLSSLSHSGNIKAPFKVFASFHNDIDKDFKEQRTVIMDRYARHEISDTTVTTEIKKAQLIADSRKEQLMLARKHVAMKLRKAQSKPPSHFAVPDTKNQYNHQDDDWWDRSLEPAGGHPKGGLPDQSVRADEGKARDEKLYDNPNNWVGRSVEKPGGIPATGPEPIRSDEDKAFGHENMYDNAKDWVGRAAQTDWNAPTSYEYMMKSERKKEIDNKISSVKNDARFASLKVSDEELNKMFSMAGLVFDKNNVLSEKIDGMKYCFGTKKPEIVKAVLDLKGRGLNEEHIAYAIFKQFPNTIVNVPDIVAAHQEITTNPKSPAGATSGKSKQAAGNGIYVEKVEASKDDPSEDSGYVVREGGITIAGPYRDKELAEKEAQKQRNKRSAAGKEDFNKSSYQEEKNDKIAVEMPEQKSWQKGDISKGDKELGRSDQLGDLKKDQKPQPTISSEEENHPVENNKKDGSAKKNAAGANPWAVCHTTVDKKENPDKFEKCVNDVKKKNVEKGAPEEGSKKKAEEVKKEAQTNQDVLPKEQRDLGKEMQFGMVTHHEQAGNNVSFGANDNVYDNTGRFGKKDPSSPYSVAHVVERILIGLKNRDYENAQAALDGVAVGEAFKRLSQNQLDLVTDALKANGFDVKAPKARAYKEPVDKR